MKALEKIPVHEIAAKATKALDGIERLINSPETREVVGTLNATLKDFQKAVGEIRTLAKNVDAQVGPLAAETKGALGDTRNAD